MRTAIVTCAFVLGACSGGANGTGADHRDTPNLLAADGTGDENRDAAAPAEAPLDDCTQEGAHEVCQTTSGVDGARRCEVGEQGYVWSECFPATECQPGQSRACFPPGSAMASMYGGLSTTCWLSNGEWRYDPRGCSTPLVLAFDDQAVKFTNPTGAFDLAGRETLVRTDWVSSETPWLVLDRNANGVIDDGAELFGSMTRLPDGARAANGFSALAPLDADRDGWLTSSDPAFERLALWRDLNQDRVSSENELTPLAESVIALSLSYEDVPRCVAGNCERERAPLVYRDRDGNERRGSVVDVYLSDR